MAERCRMTIEDWRAKIDSLDRRLAELQAKYDPDNAFHHNKNIQPG